MVEWIYCYTITETLFSIKINDIIAAISGACIAAIKNNGTSE